MSFLFLRLSRPFRSEHIMRSYLYGDEGLPFEFRYASRKLENFENRFGGSYFGLLPWQELRVGVDSFDEK